jgi:hypothetical protein
LAQPVSWDKRVPSVETSTQTSVPSRESVGLRLFGRWYWSAPSWATPRIRTAIPLVLLAVSGLLVGFVGGHLWLALRAPLQ